MCDSGINVGLFYDLLFDFGTVPTVWYMFFFSLITNDSPKPLIHSLSHLLDEDEIIDFIFYYSEHIRSSSRFNLFASNECLIDHHSLCQFGYLIEHEGQCRNHFVYISLLVIRLMCSRCQNVTVYVQITPYH